MLEAALVILTAVLAASTVAYTVATWQMMKESKAVRAEQSAPQLVIRLKRAGRGADLPSIINIGQGWLRDGQATIVFVAPDGTEDERHVLLPTLGPGEDIEFMPRDRRFMFEDLTSGLSNLRASWSGKDATDRAVAGTHEVDVTAWAQSMKSNEVRDATTHQELIEDKLERVARSGELQARRIGELSASVDRFEQRLARRSGRTRSRPDRRPVGR